MITISQVHTAFVTPLKTGIGTAVFCKKVILFIRANWMWCVGALLLLIFIGYAVNNYYQETQRKKEELQKK
jgi:hypothetical protein